MRNRLLLLLLCGFFLRLSGQSLRVEPPNWWVGMVDPELELLIQGEDAGAMSITSNQPGFRILEVTPGDSPNYLFVRAEVLADARPGQVALTLTHPDGRTITHDYPLQLRERPAASYAGFSSSDVICLVTPDRFANGDPTNDVVPGLREAAVDRTDGYARHGGDLAGLIGGLDYLSDMGFTVLWPNPLLTNDMPKWSYHGYAITDFYQVDPRFGTLADYHRLADELRNRGMKLIMDQVANHCGSSHWWMDDLPFDDWLNHQRDPKITNHRRTVNIDPYAARTDRELLTTGWFVPSMPDLNQRNPHLARYLIQNSLWWIETLGLGGIRQDTYPYPDKEFIRRWACRIMEEYPNFNIVGEEWSFDPNLLAYWQRGNDNSDGYVSCLPSVMDFPQQRALVAALTEEEAWDKGLVKLYEGLANDHAYPNPSNLLTLIDNHDMDRAATVLGGDTSLLKMAHTYLATMRGIPQLLYGGEVILENDRLPGDHGLIRSDMPGGWPGDPTNAFTGQGLTDRQLAIQTHLRTLLNWRKDHPVIASGQTIHYSPEKGTYVVGRYNERERVMIVYNKNQEATSLELDRFAELLGPGSELRPLGGGTSVRIYGDEATTDYSTLTIPARTAVVYEIH